MVLAGLADGVIYVVESDATTAQIASNGMEGLLRAKAHLVAVGLNLVCAAAWRRYGELGAGF